MNLQEIHRVYMIGIGGIGMSALALYFLQHGKSVAGYDRADTSITSNLTARGANIHFTDDVSLIPPEFNSADQTLVVYTPAIPASHSELNFFKRNNFVLGKRSQVLANIVKDKNTIAVAGTHGKTTTSAIIAHLLKEAGIEFYAFLGGISVNLDSNYHGTSSTEPGVAVVEADEYDRSFLHLQPETAIVTSIDADHLDIYGKAEDVYNAFNEFTSRVKPGGRLIIRKNLEQKISTSLETETFDLENADSKWSAENIRINEGNFFFDIRGKHQDVKLAFPGRHNILNALAALAATWPIAGDKQALVNSLATFKGVKRRFEFIIKSDSLTFIDDYAHHPEELRATIEAVKELYPSKKITGIFQPHLYSRTRDFADGFALSLSMLDKIILLDIYPAREEPIPGITSRIIFDKIHRNDKFLINKVELLQFMENEKPEVLLTLGAGDIDTLVEPLKIQLQT